MIQNLKKQSFFSLSIAIILILGIYYRIEYYDDGLWSDEWISFFISTLDIEILEKYNLHLQFEGSSPINLFLNTFLINIFGSSYQSLEKFYILSGIFLLIFSLKLFKKNNTKIFYFLLLSLNPFLIFYSGELRFYTFSVLFSLLSFITFSKLNDEQSNMRIIVFSAITIISLMFNIYTISLIISYFIFNYFKKKSKKIYFTLFVIIIIFFIFNLQYLLTMTFKYHSQFGDVGGNINIKFFIGYFFNIFFGDKLFGAVNLIIFLYSLIHFRKNFFNNNNLFLSYLVIFTTYAMFISYALIVSDIFFPRHFIFIIPLIIYSIVFFIFDLKHANLRYLFILFFIFMSFYVNLKSNKPYMTNKPNPNFVNDKILNSNIKYIYIPVVKNLENLENTNCCNYDELLFAYSNSFKKDRFILLLNDEYKDHQEFWSICIINPSFRRLSELSVIKNCYGRLNFLEDNFKITDKFSSSSFEAYLYKKN